MGVLSAPVRVEWISDGSASECEMCIKYGERI
jgi:hypothetical protein